MSFSNSSSFTGQRKRINLSQDEKKVYAQLFKQCDPEGLGIVTGDVARTLLERSGLSSEILGEIWQRADVENNGFLDQLGFSLALRLIGSVQAGYPLTVSSGDQPIQLPVFDGKTRPDPVQAPVQAPVTAPVQSPISAQAPVQTPHIPRTGNPPAPSRIPLITPADKQRFIELFQRNAPSGFLEGEIAKNIFTKANLPNETLGQIWTLADTQSRGALDQSEFIIAMHLIQSVRNGSLNKLPSSLPPGFVDSIVRPSSNNSFRTPSNVGQSQTIRLVQPQYTGSSISSNNTGRQSPAVRGVPTVPTVPTVPAVPSTIPGSSDWTISSQEKVRYDGLFDSLDKQKAGTISANEVVPFLKMSKLPEDTLAQVWDLADIQNTGVFTKTEFAIAMYLVQQKLTGKELPLSLPPSILASLTPGASRQSSYASLTPNQVFAAAPAPEQQQQRQFQQPQVQQPQPRQVSTASQQTVIVGGGNIPPPVPPGRAPATTSALDDLVSLNDVFSSPPTLPRQSTLPLSPKTETGQKQFVPSSSFGLSLAKSESPVSTPPISTASAPPVRDLLVDDDPQISNQLSSATTEFANLSNQISSLTTQTKNITDKRERSEQELAQLLSKKKDIEGKLAVLRTNYDGEVQRVHQVQELLNTSKAETVQVIKDYSVVEASLQALQGSHQQISTEYEKDRQENAIVKDKLRLANEQTTSLKAALEQLEKENKQHKLRHNVAQQQLSVVEEQNKKLADEFASLKEQNASLEASASAAEAAAVAAAQQREALTAQVAAATQKRDALTAQVAAASEPPVQRGLGNPFSSHFTGSQLAGAGVGAAIGATAAAASFFHSSSNNDEFDESFRQLEIASPSTAEPARSSTHNTVETPSSSPPTSDYQVYNQGEGENMGIPSFHLPLARPLSATSSVQNNPPMSVRDDLDVSRPDSPTEVTTEPVSGIVPPASLDEDNKFDEGLRALEDGTHASDIAVEDREVIENEHVNEPEPKHEYEPEPEPEQSEQSEPLKLESGNENKQENIPEELRAEPVESSAPAEAESDSEENVEESIKEPVKEPVEESIERSVEEPVKEPIEESIEGINEPKELSNIPDIPVEEPTPLSEVSESVEKSTISEPEPNTTSEKELTPHDTTIALSTSNIIDPTTAAVAGSGTSILADALIDDHHESAAESFEFVDAEDQDDAVHQKSVDGGSSSGFPALTTPPVPTATFPSSSDWPKAPNYNPEFPPIQDLQQDEDSSSDEEDTPDDDDERRGKGSDVETLDKFVTPQSTGDNAEPSPFAVAGISSTAAATSSAPPTSADEFKFNPDSSGLSVQASGSTVTNENPFGTSSIPSIPAAPTAIPAPTQTPFSNIQANTAPVFEEDPFASAFSGLSEAKEDKGDFSEDFTNGGGEPAFDEFENTFDRAFNDDSNNFGITSTFGTASQSSAGGALPGSGSGTGSDEWEQLFAGFSSNVPPPAVTTASEKDINDAFTVPSLPPPQLPPKPVSPNSSAVNELVGMGFSKDDALDALKKKNFNLAEASNYLLDRSH